MLYGLLSQLVHLGAGAQLHSRTVNTIIIHFLFLTTSVSNIVYFGFFKIHSFTKLSQKSDF